MSDGHWTTIYAIGVVQGAFLFGALLLRRDTNRNATLRLALLVAVFTLMILGGLLQQVLGQRLAQLVAFLNINTELAIGPLLLLFMRSVLEPGRGWRRQDSLHFLPMALGLGIWIFAWLSLGGRGGQGVFDGFQAFLPRYVLFKAGVLGIYVFTAYQTLAHGRREARRFVTGRRSVGLRWLERWVLGLGILPGLCYLVYFAGIWRAPLPFESDPFASLVLAAMIYLTSLMVLLRPWILSIKPRPSQAPRWADEADRLNSHLERDRSWLNPELGLGDLAEELGWAENRLSAVINEGLGTSFYRLLNRYRIAEFERLTRNPALRDRSVLDLAFEAGFNSKASFYRAFREAHGTTPTAYRAKR